MQSWSGGEGKLELTESTRAFPKASAPSERLSRSEAGSLRALSPDVTFFAAPATSPPS